MTEQYEAWQSDFHYKDNNPDGMQAECIDCHFLPGEKYGLKAKYEGLRHLAAYLYDKDAPLPIRPVIKDGACLQSGCHNRETVAQKEIQRLRRRSISRYRMKSAFFVTLIWKSPRSM